VERVVLNALGETLQLCRLIFAPFGDPFPIAFRRSRSTFSSVTQVERVVLNALGEAAAALPHEICAFQRFILPSPSGEVDPP
jgi:hypothetical protein